MLQYTCGLLGQNHTQIKLRKEVKQGLNEVQQSLRVGGESRENFPL